MVIGVPLVLVSGYFLWRWLPDFTMASRTRRAGGGSGWTLVGCGSWAGSLRSADQHAQEGGTLALWQWTCARDLGAHATLAIWALIIPVL
jgi:hypothetical protein